MTNITAQMIADANAAVDAGTANQGQHDLLSDLVTAEITCACELTEQGEGALTLATIRAALADVVAAHPAPEFTITYELIGRTDARVRIGIPGDPTPDVTISLYAERYGQTHNPPIAEIGWYSGSGKSPAQVERMSRMLRSAAAIAENPQAAWDTAVRESARLHE